MNCEKILENSLSTSLDLRGMERAMQDHKDEKAKLRQMPLPFLELRYF